VEPIPQICMSCLFEECNVTSETEVLLTRYYVGRDNGAFVKVKSEQFVN